MSLALPFSRCESPFDLDLPLPASVEVSLLPLALDLPLSEVGADLGGVVGAVVPLVGAGVLLAACALLIFCLSFRRAFLSTFVSTR